MADIDGAKTVAQRRDVAHAQFHKTGGTGLGVIVAIHRLARAAYPVALVQRPGMDRQHAGAANLVVARQEVQIIGNQRNAAGIGDHHTAVQAQQGFARIELHIDLAVDCIQAAVALAIAGNAQAVGLAHHDAAKHAVAVVDNGQAVDLSIEHAINALGRHQGQMAVSHLEARVVDIENAGGLQFKVGSRPVLSGRSDHYAAHHIEVAHGDAVQAVLEDDVGVVELKLMVAKQHSAGAGHGVQYQVVVTALAAADGYRRTGAADPYLVVAGTQVEHRAAAVYAYAVIAVAGGDGVVAAAEFHIAGTVAANILVVAVAAVPGHAADIAAYKAVVAVAAANNAAGRAANNHKAVIASAAVKVQHRIDAAPHIDGVIAAAANRHNAFDANIARLNAE